MSSWTRGRRAMIHVSLAVVAMPGLVTGAVPSPPAVDGPYVIRTWRMEDGLPENRVGTVTQTDDGYLWIGTFNGLARFDGVNFRVFDTVTTPLLRDCAIRTLFVDRGGTLWLGHHNGQLTTYAQGQFTARTSLAGWPNLEIDSLVEDAQARVWVMNRGGWVVRFDDGTASLLVEPGAENLVNHLHVDMAGDLWAHRDDRLVRLGPEGKPSDGPDHVIVGAGPMVACASRAGGIWIADTRLRRWQEDRWVEDRGPLPWTDPGLTALMETRAGDVWVGTYTKGLYVAPRQGIGHEVNARSGLSHNTISCLCEDREGSVWVGTGGGGLNLLRRKRVQMVSPPDLWQNHPVLCVTTNRSGGLWVGTEGAGVYAYDQGQWRNYDDRHGIVRRDAWSVHEDATGGVWVGSAWNGVLRRQNGQFGPAPGWPEPTWNIYAMFPSSSGELWVGGERGVGWWQAGFWHLLDLDPGLVEERVRHIAQDASGTIWFATAGNGLWSYREGKVARYGRGQGLLSEYLTCLHADADRNLWIGTKGGGLWRHRQGRFAAITTANGLPSDTVMSIASGAAHLWLATFSGLVRVNAEQLAACAEGRRRTIDFLQLDLSDGLKSLQFEGPNQPNACRTPDGRLWFATGAGLALVDERDIYTNTLAPGVVIDRLLVDGESLTPSRGTENGPRRAAAWDAYSLTPSVVVPAGARRVEIQYAGLSFAAPQRMRFQHRLEGWEDRYTDAGNGRAAHYNYLQPGQYVFHVRACNNDGVWNESGARLALTVLPHFWQTSWFRIGVALAGAAAIAASVAAIGRVRHRRKLQAIERQRAVERERGRIAQDIHDDLGANLTRIGLLSESALGKLEAASAPAAADVQRIHRTAHDLTCALDEIVWAVNPRHDTVDSLVNYLTNYAEETLQTADIRLNLDLPVALPPWPLCVETRHNLFLAVKEALHNVVKHAQATEVRLHFETAPEGFMLEVRDNGRGFANAEPGDGLWSMNKRLQDIGGDCRVQGYPGQGTCVRFHVRLTAADRSATRSAEEVSSEQTIPPSAAI